MGKAYARIEALMKYRASHFARNINALIDIALLLK
jgi:hypothetical protein